MAHLSSSTSVLDKATVFSILTIIILGSCHFELTFSVEEDLNPTDRSVTSTSSSNNQDRTRNINNAHLKTHEHDRQETLAGHLQPLGAHRLPEKNGIDVLDVVPGPLHFFDNYVKEGRPVLFRGAAKNMQAFKLWSDDYLRSTYGNVLVEVEEGKKENRSQGVWSMTLADYVNHYQQNDMYMVHTVPPEMAGDVGLLRCLQCSSFTKYLQDAVIWYSSGGTKSVLHFDSVDNVNCVIDGEKELFMVDKKEKDLIAINNPLGGFSNVDVDRVDMNRYPGLGKVPWYNVTMHPGDCLFIPYKWFHHVHSQGRNLAVNIWFVHNLHFDRSTCQQKIEDLPEFVPLSQFQVASKSEQLRAELVNILDELETEVLQESDIELISETLNIVMETAKKVFDMLDVDHTKQVSLEEIFTFDMSLLTKFLPEEDESEDEEQHDEL